MPCDLRPGRLYFTVSGLLAFFLIGCGGDGMDFDPALSGGETTVFDATSEAFAMPAPNLSPEGLERHLEGDVAFEDTFVTAPAPINSGLGPVFNNTACVLCHPKDGRGRPPEAGGRVESIFLRLSVPGRVPVTGGPRPVPGFGTQLQQRAIFGHVPEGDLVLRYEEQEERLGDGSLVRLRRPTYEIGRPYRPLPSQVLISPRVAPPVFGRGLLEAIPDATLLALADEDDSDGDGISGRPNRVWDVTAQRKSLGRFGLKAGNPTLLQQSAGAYHEDMGVTNPVFPFESSQGQSQDDQTPDDPEIGRETVELVEFYVQTLGVPARRDLDDPAVRRGERLFERTGCAACHVPTLETGMLPGVPEVSSQTIHPYTDLLLHDLGDGLADGRPEFEATGREWRTPPLWGIGLSPVVNGHSLFLHDGRARGFLEAILWHGGEAEPAREAVRRMPRNEREDLLAFLRSL